MLVPMNVPSTAGLTPATASTKSQFSSGAVSQASVSQTAAARPVRRFEYTEAPDRGDLYGEAPDAGLGVDRGGRGSHLGCESGQGRSRS